MTPTEEIVSIVERELAQRVSAGAHAITAQLRTLYGSAVSGVLFYGSCLRRGDDEGLLDLYVLVDRYHDAYSNRALVTMNLLLPPNVFYLETQVGDRVVRAKYAVLRMRDLPRLTSSGCFEPYFWARFAQPCALVYARDDDVRRQVAQALTNAVSTFVKRGVPLVAPRFQARELWTNTWHETYRAELRAERPGVTEALWNSAAGRYEQVTRLALNAAGLAPPSTAADGAVTYEVRLSDAARRRARVSWALRRLHGKPRFLLRMLRNGLIFDGGVEYVLWKIQRHSGIETDRSWRAKRVPLLALGAEAWRLYRAGAFR